MTIGIIIIKSVVMTNYKVRIPSPKPPIIIQEIFRTYENSFFLKNIDKTYERKANIDSIIITININYIPVFNYELLS